MSLQCLLGSTGYLIAHDDRGALTTTPSDSDSDSESESDSNSLPSWISPLIRFEGTAESVNIEITPFLHSHLYSHCRKYSNFSFVDLKAVLLWNVIVSIRESINYVLSQPIYQVTFFNENNLGNHNLSLLHMDSHTCLVRPYCHPPFPK